MSMHVKNRPGKKSAIFAGIAAFAILVVVLLVVMVTSTSLNFIPKKIQNEFPVVKQMDVSLSIPVSVNFDLYCTSGLQGTDLGSMFTSLISYINTEEVKTAILDAHQKRYHDQDIDWVRINLDCNGDRVFDITYEAKFPDMSNGEYWDHNEYDNYSIEEK